MTKKELIGLLADVPDDMPIYCYDMAYGCYAPLTEDANNCQCIGKNGEPVNQCDECPR